MGIRVSGNTLGTTSLCYVYAVKRIPIHPATVDFPSRGQVLIELIGLRVALGAGIARKQELSTLWFVPGVAMSNIPYNGCCAVHPSTLSLKEQAPRAGAHRASLASSLPAQ